MAYSSKVSAKPLHPGLRLKSPFRYDWLVWLLTFGRPRRFRELMLRPAQLRSGETVLDVSCGTGALALLAKEQVGPEGRVYGIDASEEMITYARDKARRNGLAVAFEVAPAQQLPFDNASFDVVLNTLALHHLPKPSRYQALGEMRRVLKPGGRAVIEDFAEGNRRIHGLPGMLKHRHGSVPPDEITSAMRVAGFEIAKTGPVGAKSLHFVVGQVPGASETTMEPQMRQEEPTPVVRSHRRLLPLAAIAILIIVLVHLSAAASFGLAMKHGLSGIGWKTVGGIAAVLLILKVASHLILAKVAWRRTSSPISTRASNRTAN